MGSLKLFREMESVSIVHVFFGVDSVYARVRKELSGSTDLFGKFEDTNYYMNLKIAKLFKTCSHFS